MLNTCSSCRGLVPEAASCCPHCDEPVARPSLGKRVAQTAVGSAFAMTLMACYGAPGGYDDDPGPTTSFDRACADATELYGDAGTITVVADTTETSTRESYIEASCGYAPGPERIFFYDPGSAQGQAGEVIITSTTSREHAVFVLDDCYDDATLLACSPTAMGTEELRFQVERLQPFYLVADSTQEGVGGNVQLEIRFEPRM